MGGEGDEFFSLYGGWTSPYEGAVIMVTKGEGHNSGQNNYTKTFFFSRKRKSNFNGHFQRKNSFHFCIINFKRTCVNCSLAKFKRVAFFHEKLYNEQQIIIYSYVTFCYDFLKTHL